MAKKLRFLILVCSLTICIVPTAASSYTLPSAQIIALMTNKFALIHSLQITQMTSIRGAEQETEKVFGEIVYVMSPYLYRSEIAGQPDKRLTIHRDSRTLQIIDGTITYDGESNNHLYRFLFSAQNPYRLLAKLKEVGIDPDDVSLTRCEGKIAYLIGELGEGGARLLVDKERFLPLLLAYDNLRFTFSDYKEVMEHTWYPHLITYAPNETSAEVYMVKDIAVNPPLDLSLFNIPLVSMQFGDGEQEKAPTP
jgi:hypothetical protein